MSPHSYLQILFLISEVALLLLKRSKSKSIKTSADKRSLLFLWLAIVGCMVAGPFLAAYHAWPLGDKHFFVYTGMAIAIIGFIVRWIAIYQLGKMFTVDVAITDEHMLKTNGLYNMVRHPSYLGLMLIIIGLSICLNNWLSLLIMIIPTWIALNYRINVEEKALTAEFGDQYTSYKNRVKKIIPFIY